MQLSQTLNPALLLNELANISLLVHIRRWHNVHQISHALSGLNNHELNDLGIENGQVHDFAEHCVE